MFNRLKRWFKRPNNPGGHVYYTRLITQQGTFYKIGYTTKPSLMERMSFGGLGDEKLIDRVLLFTFREDAWDVEQTLLEHFDKHRAFGKFSNDPMMPLAGRGQSELFSHDVLGLDSDLYRLSEEQQAALKVDLAQSKDGCLMVLLGLVLIPFTLGFSLFFIAGGASYFFGSGAGTRLGKKQPQHTSKIQELVNELVQAGPQNKGTA
ncbi:GIY-YIG nuclease family protein [Polaromonas sp.]|uniref:GIY-YIG nuclease family protein n=1 Tax=Polaromonas sp. TaxID=1869339 RepID=UPI003565D4C3